MWLGPPVIWDPAGDAPGSDPDPNIPGEAPIGAG